ncbi:MAG TPA: sporulation integral membrane protein YtvI [Acetivibrio sp.]|nr:sporulation integral membrane protein YtvI [Acetivibrio sp.]
MNQKVKFILKIILTLVGTFIGIILTLKLSVYVAPFIIAFVISSIIEPLIRFLMKKAKFPRRLAAIVSLLLVLSVISVLMLLFFSRLYNEVVSLTNERPQYLIEIYQNVSAFIRRSFDAYLNLPDDITSYITNMISNLSQSVSKVFDPFIKGLYNAAISIPQVIIFILVTVLATYFFSSDRDRIYESIKHNVPEFILEKAISIKDNIFMAFFGYIRAQLILMSITFTELSIGFAIIGIRRFLLLALVISFIDAFPVLGTGGVLVPWAIYEFITRDFRMGISLIILYVIVLVIRQMIEPKILGQQIGLHPLITLMAMYLGTQFYGIVGFILGPIIVLLFKNTVSGFIKQKSIKEIINEFNNK